MMWQQGRKFRRSSYAAMVLLAGLVIISVMSMYVYVTRCSLSGNILDMAPTATPATRATTWWSTENLSSTITRGPTPCPKEPSQITRTVQLDISDVAVLLRLLENTTTAVEPQDVQPDEAAVRRVSEQVNNALRAFQQDRCRATESEFTDTGSWCQGAVDKYHMTDHNLANSLANFFAGSTVLGLGDGTGVYRGIILNVSQVKRYDSYDGAPFSEEFTGGAVRFLDLSVPQLWLPSYDWVVCLEVIEHIPSEFESIVLDNVIRPAKVGVVLSWAYPTQPGTMHVNGRPLEYVHEELKRRGLTPDVAATEHLRTSSVLEWFQTNIVVFRKTNGKFNSSISPLGHLPSRGVLTPVQWTTQARQINISTGS